MHLVIERHGLAAAIEACAVHGQPILPLDGRKPCLLCLLAGLGSLCRRPGLVGAESPVQ